jgi:hypothetical protein
MSDATTGNDETTQWFDEEFASTIKPVREPTPMTFEAYLERLEHRQEHQALVAAFRRNRPKKED